ncbi:MAG: hypothetical protein AMS14_05100 [Planctomycetes bacterium DG_20]|nr:MAG: hypothetical protein AMS14_05100 [Planctomycetes bacterium DG_20]
MAAKRESQAALAARAAEIGRRLAAEYPDAKCRLNHSSPFELLLATILAAQCTDDKVNEVTAAFFTRANTPQAIARMRRSTLEAAFRPTGFFRNKARSVHEMSKTLVKKFGGQVPDDMDDLVSLPGVARKTANVVRATCFGLPAIITDTHVIRLSGRMGLTRNTAPERIERDLMRLLPQESWSTFSHAMLFHGRAVCGAKRPACEACVVADLCPSACAFPHFAKQRSSLL